MKALTWHGKGDMRCESVPDPTARCHHQGPRLRDLRIRPAHLRRRHSLDGKGGRMRTRRQSEVGEYRRVAQIDPRSRRRGAEFAIVIKLRNVNPPVRQMNVQQAEQVFVKHPVCPGQTNSWA